jgi:hypothetical protein
MQFCVGRGAFPIWLRRVHLRCDGREPILVLCASPRGAQGCFLSMPLLPRQRCPAKTVPVWRWYTTWPDEKGREGYALPSVSTFSTEGSALRLPVAASTVLGGGVFRSANKGQKEKPANTAFAVGRQTTNEKALGGVRSSLRTDLNGGRAFSCEANCIRDDPPEQSANMRDGSIQKPGSAGTDGCRELKPRGSWLSRTCAF